MASGAVFGLPLLAVDVVRLLRIKACSSVDISVARAARNAPVARSGRVRTPTAMGYLRPRIVVPADLRGRLNGAEWRAILVHESAHLARYDDWSKAVQTALARLCWFAPAVWLLGARLDLERELASDEHVLRAAVDPRAYAACLIRLACDVRRQPAPAAWTRRSQVAVRVERLLHPATAVPPGVRAVRLGLLVAAIAGPRPVRPQSCRRGGPWPHRTSSPPGPPRPPPPPRCRTTTPPPAGRDPAAVRSENVRTLIDRLPASR